MKKFLIYFTVFLIVYVTGYFLLMARYLPAVDGDDNFVFRSSFRMAPSAGRFGPLTIEFCRVTVFNYIFYPMDCIYYSTEDRKIPWIKASYDSVHETKEERIRKEKLDDKWP